MQPLGVLDLSLITDLLIQLLNDAVNNSGLWVNDPTGKPAVSGVMPDVTRAETPTNNTLSVCLIHASADKFQRNFVAVPSAPPHQRALQIPEQPLGVDLFYLVTVFDPSKNETSYIHEQKAMSVALKCFHENPIVHMPAPPQSPQAEFTLTMEVQTSDDVARLWQSITAPYRLSVFYKASVIFLTPPDPKPLAREVLQFTLTVDPASLPLATSGQLVGTSSTVSYTKPNGTPTQSNYAPALVAPLHRFFIYGAGLNPQPAPWDLYLLLPPDFKTEQKVTSWKPNTVLPKDSPTDSRIILELPSASPPPGVYQIAVGTDTPYRTNATPFSICARADTLSGTGAGPYTVKGAGFVVGQTSVLLETIPLTDVSPANPGPGQFCVNDPQTITFDLPSGLMAGSSYAIRIRVNQVESPPALWVKV